MHQPTTPTTAASLIRAGMAPPRRRMPRALALAVLAALLVLAGVLWRHTGDIDAYRRYAFDKRPALKARFDLLTGRMDEAALQAHWPGVPLRCIDEPRTRNLLGDRVCWVDVSRIDGVPAMQLAAFFVQGRLVYVAIDLPWWAHHTALRQLVAQFGAPEAIDDKPVPAPVVQWRTRSGRLKLNRNPGYDPLQTSHLQWRADVPPAAPPAPLKPRLPS